MLFLFYIQSYLGFVLKTSSGGKYIATSRVRERENVSSFAIGGPKENALDFVVQGGVLSLNDSLKFLDITPKEDLVVMNNNGSVAPEIIIQTMSTGRVAILSGGLCLTFLLDSGKFRFTTCGDNDNQFFLKEEQRSFNTDQGLPLDRKQLKNLGMTQGKRNYNRRAAAPLPNQINYQVSTLKGANVKPDRHDYTPPTFRKSGLKSSFLFGNLFDKSPKAEDVLKKAKPFLKGLFGNDKKPKPSEDPLKKENEITPISQLPKDLDPESTGGQPKRDILHPAKANEDPFKIKKRRKSDVPDIDEWYNRRKGVEHKRDVDYCSNIPPPTKYEDPLEQVPLKQKTIYKRNSPGGPIPPDIEIHQTRDLVPTFEDDTFKKPVTCGIR